ncbi:uncharacterized protein LOC135816485 [Sycon ciliatum]|uniref:uncharacterized protein LOC135816485 n=1 Tax=Sycon ciliatum TaxID=27933 RepID=UPI0031F632EC
MLHNFLVWLMSDKYHAVVQSTKISVEDPATCRRVQSIAQDVMFATASAIPPKHIVLALTLHHLFRSEKLTTMLNRLGHCIAYSQVLERETKMAEDKLVAGHVVDQLPDVINPSTPFYHVADNNDLNEETVDGKGTTHCTNTIVVQPILSSEGDGTWLPGAQGHERSRKRKRALDIQPEVFADIVCAKNVNPARRPGVTQQQLEGVMSDGDAVALNDFTWRRCRSSRSGELLDPVVEVLSDLPEQKVPSWSAFNALVSRKDVPPKSRIGYCPVMNASPTESSTVYALLTKCLRRCQNSDLSFTLIVFDQAIYAKAVDIVTQRGEEFAPIVLRLGAFHIACTFLAIIGKRFRDAGLLDLLVESGVAGTASASSALDGRHYNRGMRFHKIASEALERLRWKEFVDASNLTELDIPLSSAFQELEMCITSDNLSRVTASPALRSLYVKYQEFCQQQSQLVPNFGLWSSYISMVDLLLRFVRASRTGNWKLHLVCVRDMLPWCFAYDRVNYARFMSFYWLDMTQLPTNHPEAHAFLEQGGFSVQRSSNPFARVASDQAIEQSINRATKTTGGIIGFSRHPATVQRWVLTAHDRAAVADVCLEHCGLDDSTEERDTFHKDCQKGRMVRDEKDVLQVIDTVSMLRNPFISSSKQPCMELIHLASGVEASKEAAQDLRTAEERGKVCFHEFLHERLTAGQSAKGFHDPLKKQNLQTFTKKKAKKTASTSNTDILRADRSTFSRMALIAQTREMDMRQVMSYPLGELPWAIASTSGALVKTNKSALLTLLTDGISSAPPTNTAAANGALIIDAMAMIRTQKLSEAPASFGEFTAVVLKQICGYFSKYTRVDFVVDTYRDISIKNLERSSRAADGVLRLHLTNRSQRMPRQFNKYLSLGTNKEELIAFLFTEWQRPEQMQKIPDGKELVTTSGQSCSTVRCVDGVGVHTPVPSLKSTHEEADTRLLLHASHAAAAGHANVTIKSPDTDVLVLAVSVTNRIPAALHFLTGTGNKTRKIPVNAVSEKLGREVCDALPAFHAFTGCDAVSSFAHQEICLQVAVLPSPLRLQGNLRPYIPAPHENNQDACQCRHNSAGVACTNCPTLDTVQEDVASSLEADDTLQAVQ